MVRVDWLDARRATWYTVAVQLPLIFTTASFGLQYSILPLPMTTPRLRPKYSTKNIIHIEDSDEELEWFSSDTQTHFEDRHRNNLR